MGRSNLLAAWAFTTGNGNPNRTMNLPGLFPLLMLEIFSVTRLLRTERLEAYTWNGAVFAMTRITNSLKHKNHLPLLFLISGSVT
jgi:hypothetical protein